MNQNQLDGSIPASIGKLTNLTHLFLFINQLNGPIPLEICNLANLEVWNIRSNQLNGPIPPDIGDLTNLRFLQLDFNQLSGSIPASIGNLNSLIYLDLGANQLSNSIPSSIGNLTNLQNLRLYSNQLSDSIPSSIGNLANLQNLFLSGNQLSYVPASMNNLSSLNSLFLQFNQLEDLPDLSEIIPPLTTLDISDNKLTFADVEPYVNSGLAQYTYSPQAIVGEEQDTTIAPGSSLTLTVSVDGSANSYQWTLNGDDIAGASNSVYTIENADYSDFGFYECRITSSVASELTLFGGIVFVTIGTTGGIHENDTSIPAVFALDQNYPNPFNPVTTINYQLPARSAGGTITNYVELAIYNILGHQVVTLVSRKQPAGIYQVEWNAGGFASGLYFYRLNAGNFVKIRRMLLLK